MESTSVKANSMYFFDNEDVDNALYYGDNFDIITRKMGKDSVDLIYLDPPFNSQKNYNIMYSKSLNKKVPEQIKAFSDTWSFDREKEEIAKSMPLLMRSHGIDPIYAELWRVWMSALKESHPRLLSYLVYMVQRLIVMKSILRPAGSIYFHCDPTASHYIKVMMDAIFGHENFRNEIIWKRTSSHNRARRWGDVHDVILFYSKGSRYKWNNVQQNLDDSYVSAKYKHKDQRGAFRYSDMTAPGIRKGASGDAWQGYDPSLVGRHWAVPGKLLDILKSEGIEIPPGVDEQLDLLLDHGMVRFGKRSDGKVGAPEAKRYLPSGQTLQDIILDIGPLNSQATERRGFPTQKPIELVRRIIEASSDEGDVVFDPFCGSGTTLFAAHEANRNWIGCEIAILPINIVRSTFHERYGLQEGRDYRLVGIPSSLDEVLALSDSNPKQFEHWVIEFVGGLPLDAGSESPFDGFIFDSSDQGGGAFPLIVKHSLRRTDIDHIRNLFDAGHLRNGLGIISVAKPSQNALVELQELNLKIAPNGHTAMIQPLSVEELVINNQRFEMPSTLGHTYGDPNQPELI